MQIKETKSTDSQTSLKIEGEITIYAINNVKNELVPHIKKETDLELDLSDVDKIDTAGFQVLVAAKYELKKTKNKFSIKNPSKEIQRIFKLYGENL